MNGRINDLMTRLGDKGSFTKVAPTQEMLAEVEEKLGFIVPEQFLEYLNIYSYGGIGFEILGVGFDGSISFLEETLEYREDGLSDSLLVIENCDEWLYCIDVNTGEVVSWSIDEDPRVEYACFDDYLVDRLNDAIENL
ncbi:SMI1/KNR4 family protein [Slackia exigua]|uniref:SMI1/KNR4 family protein n=1 Tax=Slackia exigua TaxID=84109 RepID=UPI00254BC766|nr:SMI1/KNR4 family protein [Slackia exigua]MDK7723899.1 SMI1/KNR4 family protein [Slackia exigua]MDK7725130.1 SMI1/KNR4 family protein [Slackia exigua]